MLRAVRERHADSFVGFVHERAVAARDHLRGLDYPAALKARFDALAAESVAQAMQAARQRTPPLIEPETFEAEGTRVLCYPGDAAHAVGERALPEPVPTRLVWRDRRFEPPEGLDALLN